MVSTTGCVGASRALHPCRRSAPYTATARMCLANSISQIGYGSDKRTKFMMPNGLRPFRVTNPQSVDILLMHNKTYAVEIARTVGGKKRLQILER